MEKFYTPKTSEPDIIEFKFDVDRFDLKLLESLDSRVDFQNPFHLYLAQLIAVHIIEVEKSEASRDAKTVVMNDLVDYFIDLINISTSPVKVDEITDYNPPEYLALQERTTQNTIQSLATPEVIKARNEAMCKLYSIELLNTVFPPWFFNFSPIFSVYCKFVADTIKASKICIIGTGSGIDVLQYTNATLGTYTQNHLEKRTVYYSDTNPKAIESTQTLVTRANSRRKKSGEKNYQTQFTSFNESLIPKSIRPNSLELITWNAPFFAIEPGEDDAFPMARVDKDFATLQKFLLEAQKYLATDGLIVLMLSEFGQEFYRALFEKYGFEAIINDGMIASNVMGEILPPEGCFNAEVVVLKRKESGQKTPSVGTLADIITQSNNFAQQLEILKKSNPLGLQKSKTFNSN